MFLKIFVIKVRPSFFKKVYAKVNASPVIFGKIPSFVCLTFKIENKRILKFQILFS